MLNDFLAATHDVSPGARMPVARDDWSSGRRIGVAGDKREREFFAVVVGDETPRRVTINERSYRFVSGCAGAGFYARTERFSTVAFTVESAVYDNLAPDAYCEG